MNNLIEVQPANKTTRRSAAIYLAILFIVFWGGIRSLRFLGVPDVGPSAEVALVEGWALAPPAYTTIR